MDFGKTGWLTSLLEEEVSRHVSGSARSKLPEDWSRLSRWAQSRRYVQEQLRTTGLLYGTPKDAETEKGKAPEEILFLAVVRTFARIALDVADITQAQPANRVRQLLVLFAILCGDLDLAEELQRAGRSAKIDTVPKKLAAKVESELEGRAMSLTGDPAYGLVLHNGATYADAQHFLRQAIDYFCRARFDRPQAHRRSEFAAARKALLVDVLVALASAERTPSFPTRRAILRQVEDLRLPERVESALRARVKQAFDRSPSLSTIVSGVRSADMRRFILEQTLLASLVDGRRSPRELAFIRDLATTLGFSSEDRKAVELAMAEFYARNRSVVDVFTVSSGAEVMGEELVDSIQRTAEKNFQRLMREIRETGELSVLLTRAARGQTLNADEKRRMREQLIDVAKAIPALAIFAAPGGLLLLIALAKVMPFNILPSAFQDEPTPEGEDAEPREETADAKPQSISSKRTQG
ncbi:MAG: TerB family tellurite resistance protein [Myxococcaceae bacterium]